MKFMSQINNGTVCWPEVHQFASASVHLDDQAKISHCFHNTPGNFDFHLLRPGLRNSPVSLGFSQELNDMCWRESEPAFGQRWPIQIGYRIAKQIVVPRGIYKAQIREQLAGLSRFQQL